MGQLIKLQDYVSRYEQNIFLYPSRFVRLKKQQWEGIKDLWANENSYIERSQNDLSGLMEAAEKQPVVNKIKGIFRFGPRKADVQNDGGVTEESKKETEAEFQFSAELPLQPVSMEGLKQQFLDQLFRFQMKWASSTLIEKSTVQQKYYFDERLKFFLQRFPDTFLVLFNPVFLLKKAPVELEAILLTPTDVWCISFLEEEDRAVFIGSKDRFWSKRYQNTEKKILNPLLALNRSEKIIQKLLRLNDVDLPIHKVLLSRNGYIDYPTAPYDVRLVEKRSFDEWFEALRGMRSPLKHIQLKAAQTLLEHCQTTCIRRVEWDLSDEEQG